MTLSADSTQLIIGILSGGAVSALISIGVFVGTTRTRLKRLEEGLKDVKEKDLENVKKDVKEYAQLNVTATKNELDGRIKVLEERISAYKEKLDTIGSEVAGLTKLFRDIGFEFFSRGIKKEEDRNG